MNIHIVKISTRLTRDTLSRKHLRNRHTKSGLSIWINNFCMNLLVKLHVHKPTFIFFISFHFSDTTIYSVGPRWIFIAVVIFQLNANRESRPTHGVDPTSGSKVPSKSNKTGDRRRHPKNNNARPYSSP